MVFLGGASSALNTFYKYTQLSDDIGFVWRDGGNLPPIPNKILHFNGWNNLAFTDPGPSTQEVLLSTDNINFEVATDYSPTDWEQVHVWVLNRQSTEKLLSYGSQQQTPNTLGEVWELDVDTFAANLITSDWGLPPIYLACGCVDSLDNNYFIGGQNLVFTDDPIMNLTVYRSSDNGATWPVFATLPSGYYSNADCIDTPSGIMVIGGGRYTNSALDNFNDKILLINKTTGSVTQIGTLPSEILGQYQKIIKSWGKYFIMKGTNVAGSNDVGVWSFKLNMDFIRITNPHVYFRQEPTASHGRPWRVFNDKIIVNMGNQVNDSGEIEKVEANFVISQYLVQWFLKLSPADRPTIEPTNENALMDVIGPYCNFAWVSTLENEGQILMPLMTTSALVMTKVGTPNMSFNGVSGTAGNYLIDNFNPFINTVYGDNLGQDDQMMFVKATTTATSGWACGQIFGSRETGIIPFEGGTDLYVAMNQNGESNAANVVGTGLFGVQRKAAGNINIINNGVVTNVSKASTAPPNGVGHILGFNNGGAHAGHWNGAVAGVFRLKGNVTDGERTTIINAINAYFTSKGI